MVFRGEIVRPEEIFTSNLQVKIDVGLRTALITPGARLELPAKMATGVLGTRGGGESKVVTQKGTSMAFGGLRQPSKGMSLVLNSHWVARMEP